MSDLWEVGFYSLLGAGVGAVFSGGGLLFAVVWLVMAFACLYFLIRSEHPDE